MFTRKIIAFIPAMLLAFIVMVRAYWGIGDLKVLVDMCKHINKGEEGGDSEKSTEV